MKATSEKEGDGSGRRDIAHSSFSSVGRGSKGEREGWAGHTTPRHTAFFAHPSHKSHSVSAAKAFHQEPQKEIRGERSENERKGDKRGEGCEAGYKVRRGKRNGAD